MKALLTDLNIAKSLLAKKMNNNRSAQEFHSNLCIAIKKLEVGDQSVISDLWIWFTPTFDWDDFGRDVNLGEKIYQQLNNLHIH